MGVTVTTTGTPDPTPEPIESPTYIDDETGIEYVINDEGKFVSAGASDLSLDGLRRTVQRFRDGEAEKAAALAKRQRAAAFTDSETAYIVPMGKEAVQTGLTSGEPVRVKVRAKAARGGWNVTIIDSGQKVAGMTVYDLDDDQLRRLAELNVDIARVRFTDTALDDKLRSPIGDPAISTERTGPTTWRARTFYYVDDDGSLTPYSGFRSGARGVEEVAEHEVTVDPVTGEWRSGELAETSLSHLRRLIQAHDNIDNGKPGVRRISGPKLDVADLPALDTYDATAPYGVKLPYIIEDPSYDRDQHVRIRAQLDELLDERRELLDAAIVGDPTEEEG